MVWCIIIILVIIAILIFGAFKNFAKGDNASGAFLCICIIGCVILLCVMLSTSGEQIVTCKEYWVDDIVTYSGDSIIDVTYRIHYKY
jgi:hypothetical protein